MSSLVHLEEGQAAGALGGGSSSGDTSLDVLGTIYPSLIGLGVEGALSRPVKLLGPGLVAHPVADEVDVTSVDEDTDVVLKERDQLLQ